MSPKLKKILLLLLAATLLVGSSSIQKSLNRDREELDLTRVAVLENAPPVLAFTTIVLGGFRGLIANMLWMRATDLQDEEKFFEMAQLTDWITKLEPNFSQVWVEQAWNLAFNISVKFPKPEDRWRWVQRGIELLRDEGLKYNPNDTLIYRELGWMFQFKLGANLDDANMYYKWQWIQEMTPIFGDGRPHFDELINPQTPEQQARARLLVQKYKMDPHFVKEVDEHYGPLEWRLPESQAIYWAAVGLKKGAENPTKVKPEDLIMLRRVIYQSMQLSFQRGKLILSPFRDNDGFPFDFGPNLVLIPKVSKAYEEAMEEDKPNRENIAQGYRNFLRDAVFYLCAHNRMAEAAEWFKYLGSKFPDKPLLNGQPNSLPGTLTLDQYITNFLQSDIKDPTSRDRIRGRLADLLARGYASLVLGENDSAVFYEQFAEKLRASYESRVANTNRVPMPSIPELKRDVLDELLSPQSYWPFEARATLRSKLGLGPETNAPPSTTNAPPQPAAGR